MDFIVDNCVVSHFKKDGTDYFMNGEKLERVEVQRDLGQSHQHRK